MVSQEAFLPASWSPCSSILSPHKSDLRDLISNLHRLLDIVRHWPVAWVTMQSPCPSINSCLGSNSRILCLLHKLHFRNSGLKNNNKVYNKSTFLYGHQKPQSPHLFLLTSQAVINNYFICASYLCMIFMNKSIIGYCTDLNCTCPFWSGPCKWCYWSVTPI